MKGVLKRALVDRLMCDFAADFRQPGLLQPFLQLAHVGVADRAGEPILGQTPAGQHSRQNGRALHLVISDAARQLWR